MTIAEILLVEDQTALARTYQGFLRQEPYNLRHVETGKAALKALQDQPAAILLDLKLPDADGRADVCRIDAIAGLQVYRDGQIGDRHNPFQIGDGKIERQFFSVTLAKRAGYAPATRGDCLSTRLDNSSCASRVPDVEQD